MALIHAERWHSGNRSGWRLIGAGRDNEGGLISDRPAKCSARVLQHPDRPALRRSRTGRFAIGAFEEIRAGKTFAFDPLILARVVGGALILTLVVWRFVLRLRRGVPAPPESEPAPLKTLSHVVHWAYAVPTAMAVTGSLAWFGDVIQAAQAHYVLRVVLMAFVALHVLAIPFHLVVLKNNVMLRMIRSAS